MDLGLNGLKAVLGGASRGIGLRTADLLAAEGCDVAFCARGEASVASASEQLRKHGGRVEGAAVDLTQPDAYRRWLDESVQALGGCDIFVCFTSAGGAPASEEQWAASFETDLLAVWRGIDGLLPALEASDAGSIVAVATTVAIEPTFGPQPYAAIKAALTNYAGALAQSLAPKGIRVNTVSPGPIEFEGGAWDTIRKGRPEFYELTRSKVALGRMGTPEEVAKAIAFLASPASAFTTGANFVVDGGMTKRVQH